ncbi:anaerobic ribonucleoside-triphosphate reductase activating protein [Staphylococcus capitis]|uniref:anaerobic ribonucleoside-triphosphate reductase activating protein n=1 Tax=Staphylococcus capitis TaxID=29388 RepID=UPI0018849F20|nr:anaerobic ribonucleoside-triphosphate reductase activating protein [Staphylococcus capitis]QOX59772.1 anaerobic ribonucleoside-triphosphate reductase activating protein [Staphylococcus capitis]
MSMLDIKTGQNHIAKIESHSFMDGEGVRCSVYVSGCPFQCKKCYNEKAQIFKYGETFSEDILQEILENCAPSYISGISILGGEPFCNLNISLKIARAFRERFGYSKTIWIWTGFLFEYLKHQTDERRELLELTDILVDGLFMYQLYKPNLPYKGSLNQRVIDVQDSLRSHGIIEYV